MHALTVRYVVWESYCEEDDQDPFPLCPDERERPLSEQIMETHN
jgi:hypothetical protein